MADTVKGVLVKKLFFLKKWHSQKICCLLEITGTLYNCILSLIFWELSKITEFLCPESPILKFFSNLVKQIWSEFFLQKQLTP